MTNRRLLCSFLSFLIASQGLMPLAYGETTEITTAKKYFLLDAKDRVAAAFDINKVYIQHTLQCLTQMTDQQFAITRISDPKNHQPKVNCHDAVAQIRENTRIKYPIMRRTLLLSQLMEGTNLNLLVLSLQANLLKKKLGLKVQNGISLKGDLSVENPLEESLNVEQIPYPEWTPDELQSILTSPDGTNFVNAKDNFNDVFRMACTRINERLKQTLLDTQFNFCPSVRLNYSATTHRLQFLYEGSELDTRKLFTEMEVYRSYVQDGLRGDQKRWTQEFLSIVQLNPYIGLVQSAQPSRTEFIKAFTIMAERASQSVIEFTNLRREKNLDNDKLADFDTLLSLMRYVPITSQLITKPGPRLSLIRKLMPMTDLDAVFKELTDEYSTQELVRMGKHVAGAMALNMFACWLPVSWVGQAVGRSVMLLTKAGSLVKLFKLGKWQQMTAKTFTPICFTAGGVILNVGFLYESIQEYQNVYRQVFGSIEEETLMNEVSQLSDKEREIFWSVVLFPVGIVSIKFLKGQYKNISERIWQKALTPSTAGGI